MTVSPIELQKALRGANYPASEEDVLECARGNDAPAEVTGALESLSDEQYDGPNEVSAAVSHQG